MNKTKLFLLILILYNVLSCTVFAKDLEDPSYAPSYYIGFEEDGSIYLKTGIQDIVLNHKIYWNEKEYCFMIPIKEFLQLSDNKISLEKNLLKETIKIQFCDNEIIFFQNKRNILLNGKELGLFTIPNIMEDELYLSLQDMCVLFEISYGEGIYDQLKIDKDNTGASLNYTHKYLKVNDLKEKQRQYRINGKDGEILKKGIYSPILTYKKENQIMIAISKLQYLTSPNINVAIIWDNMSNTAYIRTWRNSLKDITIKENSNILYCNEKMIKMPTNAEIKNNQLYIPISTWFEIIEIPKENIMWYKDSVMFSF